jgi:hypothetical protein
LLQYPSRYDRYIREILGQSSYELEETPTETLRRINQELNEAERIANLVLRPEKTDTASPYIPDDHCTEENNSSRVWKFR